MRKIEYYELSLVYSIFLDFFTRTSYIGLILEVEFSGVFLSIALLHSAENTSGLP